MQTHLANNQYSTIKERPTRFRENYWNRKNSDTVGIFNSLSYDDFSTLDIINDKKEDDNLISLKKRFFWESERLSIKNSLKASFIFDRVVNYFPLLSPDDITVEVTDDDSLYFSMLKNSYSAYLGIYLDDYEAYVSLFDNKIKQDSITGSLDYVMKSLITKIS